VSLAVRALVNEARRLGLALREEAASPAVGPIVVSGVLAEQLAKELGRGAEPGAVIVGSGPPTARAEVHVHIVAGDPSPDDEERVDEAVALGVEVVIVELWPQPDWTRPFVLSPFIVECRAGEGFPVDEIAERIIDATENGTVLASSVPAIAGAARTSVVTQAVLRSALIGLAGARLGASRPLLTLEQVRMVSRLRAVSMGPAVSDELRVLGGGAAAVAAAGLAFRGAARSARMFAPAPLANAAVAAIGTWALAKAFQTIEARLPAPERTAP
jgi:hypothetical protein